MSQQAPDLPRSVQIIGRYRALVGVTAAAGLLAGTVFAALSSPSFTSSALVVVAPPCPAGAICGGPAFAPADIQAGLLKAFPGRVQVKLVTGGVLSVSAVARTAAQAEASADAAARSYIADISSLSYLGQPVSAQLLHPATSATGTAPPKRLFIGAMVGAAFGVLLGVIAALAGGRTTIDPLAPPRALEGSEGDWGAGKEPRYASTGLSLERLAQDYARQKAPPYGSGPGTE